MFGNRRFRSGLVRLVGLTSAVWIWLVLLALVVPGEFRLQAQADFSCEDVLEIPYSECLALVAFYNSTNGPMWHTEGTLYPEYPPESPTWLLDNTPCDWFGVVCADGHVTELRLGNNGVRGSLPPQIKRLKFLTILELFQGEGDKGFDSYYPSSFNRIEGELPPALGKLSRLKVLDLRGSAVTGTIPLSWGKLDSLEELLIGFQEATYPNYIATIGSPNLSGELPFALSQMENLTTLDLSTNEFSGPLPTWWGNLTKLKVLDLSKNAFTGKIPIELDSLPNLTHLRLGGNRFEGKIPKWLKNNFNLVELDLGDNLLKDKFPLWITAMPNLEILDLSSSGLTGTIPTAIGDTALRKLMLERNSLSGYLPESIMNLAIPPWQYHAAYEYLIYSLGLEYNALLFPANDALHAYLSDKSQYVFMGHTTPPGDLAMEVTPFGELVLTWTPIGYQDGPGYYEVGCDQSPTGTFDQVFSFTDNKATSTVTFAGIPAGQYYCKIRTVSLPNEENRNTVVSDYADFPGPSDPVPQVDTPPNDAQSAARPLSLDIAHGLQYYSLNIKNALPDGAVNFPAPTCGAPALDPTKTKGLYFEIPIGQKGEFSVTSSRPGHFSVTGIDADTVLAIYTESGVEVACNDDYVTGSRASNLIFRNVSDTEKHYLALWVRSGEKRGVVLDIQRDEYAVVNNSTMERDLNRDRIPDGWVILNSSGERLDCNKFGKLRVSYAGSCAFRFKGKPGEQAVLRQNVPSDFIAQIQPNDTLILKAQVKGKEVAGGGVLRTTLKLTNTTIVISTDIPQGSTEDANENLTFVPIEAQGIIPQGKIQKVIVEVEYTGTTGTFWIDNVGLFRQPQAGLPLPQPPVTDLRGTTR